MSPLGYVLGGIYCSRLGSCVVVPLCSLMVVSVGVALENVGFVLVCGSS